MKYLILIFFSLVISSCKNNNVKVINEDLVVLKPNILEIKKKYHKYSTFNPFDSTEFLCSPIEPSKNEKGKARILVSKLPDPFDYHYFYSHIKNKMSGNYESYLISKNKIIYRVFYQFHKDDGVINFNELRDFENYFNKNKIRYKLHRQQYLKYDNTMLYVFFLKNNIMKDSIYCSIYLTKEKIETHLFYNVKDTIKALPWHAMEPYKGKKIEN